MKITTLIENKAGDNESLDYEHGLSVYIEVEGKKILFDTGQSGNFVDNAKKLNINLKELDYIIISHGHYDHSGGFERLIKEINPSVKLYISTDFFNKKYNHIVDSEYEYTGNSFGEDFLSENKVEVVYIDEDITEITEKILMFTEFNRNEEFENTNENMYIKEGEKFKRDMFSDEIVLGLESKQGLVLIVGCAHGGIVNIIDTIIEKTKKNIYGLLGGTHLVKEDDEKINKIIEYFKEKSIEIVAACHCTGKHGETMLEQQLGNVFMGNNTGNTLFIEI